MKSKIPLFLKPLGLGDLAMGWAGGGGWDCPFFLSSVEHSAYPTPALHLWTLSSDLGAEGNDFPTLSLGEPGVTPGLFRAFSTFSPSGPRSSLLIFFHTSFPNAIFYLCRLIAASSPFRKLRLFFPGILLCLARQSSLKPDPPPLPFPFLPTKKRESEIEVR